MPRRVSGAGVLLISKRTLCATRPAAPVEQYTQFLFQILEPGFQPVRHRSLFETTTSMSVQTGRMAKRSQKPSRNQRLTNLAQHGF